MTCFTVASQLTPTQSEALAKAQEADLLAAAALVKFDIAERDIETARKPDAALPWEAASERLTTAVDVLIDAQHQRNELALAFVRTFKRES